MVVKCVFGWAFNFVLGVDRLLVACDFKCGWFGYGWFGFDGRVGFGKGCLGVFFSWGYDLRWGVLV